METRSNLETPQLLTTKLVGYASVFNSPTTILDKSGRSFTEIVRPGAFRKALTSGNDIKALHNHDRYLARTKNGTLRLEEDSRGLRYEIEIPNTNLGNDVRAEVERGDLSGGSFGWLTHRDKWGTKDDMPFRELLDIDVLEVSVVYDPAYPKTSVDLRSIALPSQNQLLRLRLAMVEKL